MTHDILNKLDDDLKCICSGGSRSPHPATVGEITRTAPSRVHPELPVSNSFIKMPSHTLKPTTGSSKITFLSTAALPILTSTTISLQSSLLSSKSAAPQTSTPLDIPTVAGRKGKVLLPKDLSSIIREDELLLQGLASEAAIPSEELVEQNSDLSEEMPKGSLKHRISAAGLLGKSRHKILEVVADLPRGGQLSNTFPNTKGKPRMVVGGKHSLVFDPISEGETRLEMFRIAGDSSNTIIFLDLSSTAGKSLEHTTLTLGGGRVLVKVKFGLFDTFSD